MPVRPDRQELLDLVETFILASSYTPAATARLRELGHDIRNLGDVYRLHAETFRRLEKEAPSLLALDHRLNTRQLALLANAHGPVNPTALDREREAALRRAALMVPVGG